MAGKKPGGGGRGHLIPNIMNPREGLKRKKNFTPPLGEKKKEEETSKGGGGFIYFIE